MSTINSSLPTFPALAGLSRLRDLRPTIIIDSREQLPLRFTRLPSATGTLTTGDYSFAGAEELFAIERKSIADLVACCVGESRERFFRELHRLRGYRFKRLLIVGSREEIEAGAYRSRITPAAVLATITTIEARFDVPAVFAATPGDAARMVEGWAWYFAREIVESANDLLRGTEASGVTPSKTGFHTRASTPSVGAPAPDAFTPPGASAADANQPPHRGEGVKRTALNPPPSGQSSR
jgi:ERCC4-type nuclease